MSNTTFTVLHSVGIKSNRRIKRAESTSSTKPAMRVATPSELGYSPSQCDRLKAILAEL